MTAELNIADIEILSRPFDNQTIGIKVQSFSKDRTKAMLVLYLQHTDVYARLEQVDPAWSMVITNTTHIGDTFYATVALTVKGVTRENTGEGSEPKGALSDAIKRAAMLFGVGRYLYDSDLVWVDYNEARDKFRVWTMKDYEDNSRKKPKPVLLSPSRDSLNQRLMAIHGPYMKKFPDTQFKQVLYERYGVDETRLLTVEQLKDLVLFLESGLGAALPGVIIK